MKRFETITSCIGALALLGAFAGCGPVRVQPVNRYQPPAPAQPAFVTPAPPTLEARLSLDSFRHETLVQQGFARTGRSDAAVRQAEWHYQLGRKHYHDGDFAAARREFDRAIDVLLAAPDASAPGVRGAVERRLEQYVDAIHRFDLAGLGSADTGDPQYEKAPLDDIPQLTFPVDPSLKHKVLEEVRATASQLPLQATDAVLSYINYFSSERGRKMLTFGIRRAGRYKALIHRILDEEGVPRELIHLAQAESGFLPRAVSRKRAVGMWQFVQARGRQYGLSQTPYSDDRLDFEKATRAAARHLHDLYQRYGDWYLALGAYNAGPGVIDRAVERTGYADFWEFRRRNVLPRETANYIPIIVAMTIMVKNPAEYGLEDVDVDPPLEYDTVELDGPTGLALIGDLAECPVSQLRELNPSLLKDVAPGGTLRIPKGSGPQLAGIDLIPADKRLFWRVHRVADGDTMAAIARRYRVGEASIASVNPMLAGPPGAGDVLVIPAAQQKRAAVKPPAKRRAAASGRAKPAPAKASAKRKPNTHIVSYSAARVAARTKTVRR